MSEKALAKVPEVTLGFWIIKIAATTLGETGGDTVTMTWLHANQNAHNGGYLIGTGLFLALLVALVIWQTFAHKFHPFLYWATIVASTTFGVPTVATEMEPSDQYQSASTDIRPANNSVEPPV